MTTEGEPTVTTRMLPLFAEPVPADADHLRVFRCEYDAKERLVQALWPERLPLDTDLMQLGALVGGGDYKVQACDARGVIRGAVMHHFIGEPKNPGAGNGAGGSTKGRVVALGQEFGKAGGIIMVDGLTGEQNAMLLLFQQRALEVREDAKAMVESFAKVFESIAQMQREPGDAMAIVKQYRNALDELYEENRRLRRRQSEGDEAGSILQELSKVVPDLPKILESIKSLGPGAAPAAAPTGAK